MSVAYRNIVDMTIGIIGNGVVGSATARSYLEHVKEVRCWDVNPRRTTHSFLQVMDSDLIFVCLPTPQGENGRADLSYVWHFFDSAPRDLNYVLRSTVPIGTTRNLAEEYHLANIVHSPEFLTARCSLVDAMIPSRNVIGAVGKSGTEAFSLLLGLYMQRFPGSPSFVMSSDESEAVKLFQNAFFAVKVGFWNEMRDLADSFKLDWEMVMRAILADGRIHPSHTNVPGPDGKRGFGGACLPKDLASLVHQMRQVGICATALHQNSLRRKED